MGNGIFNGMNVRIDRAGRVVLPKPLRDKLGLKAGSELDLSEAETGILLTPIQEKPSLIRRNGLLIHTGKLPKGYRWDEILDHDREERIRKLGGL